MEPMPESISIETANPVVLLRDKLEEARVLRLRRGIVRSDRLKQEIDRELLQINAAIQALLKQTATAVNMKAAQ